MPAGPLLPGLHPSRKLVGDEKKPTQQSGHFLAMKPETLSHRLVPQEPHGTAGRVESPRAQEAPSHWAI